MAANDVKELSNGNVFVVDKKLRLNYSNQLEQW